MLTDLRTVLHTPRSYLYFKLLDCDGSIIGAVVKRPMYDHKGQRYGQTYRVYAEPGFRVEAVIQQAESRLARIGVEYDTTNPCNQTIIEWGNELPQFQFVRTFPNSFRELPVLYRHGNRWYAADDYSI